MTIAVQKQVLIIAKPRSIKTALPTLCSKSPVPKNTLKKDKLPVKPFAISKFMLGMMPIRIGKNINFGDFFKPIKMKNGIKYNTEEIRRLS
jgi:hypothetical protein